VKIHVECSAKRAEEVGNKLRSTIKSNIEWDFILGEYIDNK